MTTSNDKPVIILGAGGHAKVVAEVLKVCGHEIIGLLTPDEEPGDRCFGVKVLGDDDAIASFLPDEVVLANGIGFLPGENLRWRLASKMRNQGYNFIKVIHPSAIIAEDIIFGDGVHVLERAVIQPGVMVGRDSIINTGAIINHDCKIGEECHMAPSVTLGGNVVVGSKSYLGIGANVIQNILIGMGSVVGAGSIVCKNLENNVKFIQPRVQKM